MLEQVLAYLEEKHVCPHCKAELTLCHAPPIHVGDGLGWGSEYLFICLNDECSMFVNGWKFIEDQYGHSGSYRHMKLPNSNENYSMMVGSSAAFTGSVVDVEELRRQDARHQAEKSAAARLCGCVEAKDISPVIYLLTDNSADIVLRRKAADLLAELNDLSCIEPLRSHTFTDPHLEHAVNLAISQILAKHYLRECPFCAELIKARAKLCKHCGKEFDAAG